MVSAATAAKGNLLSVFTACECVEPLFYIMSALIHSMFSVPALGRVNFWMRKMATYGETESEQAVKAANRKTEREERREGKTETVGVRQGLPPFSSSHFSHYLSHYYPPSFSLSLPYVSAALSDATLQSKTAIATSRACSVSRTDTGVFTI